MSPNGLNAPPAFEATTILTMAIETKRGLLEPTANTTAPMISAVVRLSAIGEMKNAKNPVIQKSCLKVKPFKINQVFKLSNTNLSRMASM